MVTWDTDIQHSAPPGTRSSGRTSTATSRSDDPPARVTLFGLEVSNVTRDEIIAWMISRVRSGQKSVVNFVNAHCLNVASRHASYHAALQRSTQVLPDGSGVKLALRMRGVGLRQNLNGTDLFPELCREACRHGLSLFLLGAAPGVAEKVADNMRARFPQLKIAGTNDGFFAAEGNAELIARINRSGADILLVAMGVPMQELWLDRHCDQLRPALALGVGGLFDFYSGRIPRAPLWFRRQGLEWVWRLLQEPGRMWRRYLLGNPEFVVRAWLDARSTGGLRHLPQLTGHVRCSGGGARRIHPVLCRQVSRLLKRALDVSLACLAGVLAAPILLLTAAAIRLESPGPVLFAQQRVGHKGKPFLFWKFRSMHVDAEHRKHALLASNEMRGGVLFKMRRDPRITRVGRVIRRFSIDELPQLWNVLRGDMSLVGPRPALPHEVAQYSLTDRQRLLVAPGITCTWQVSGRSEIPFDRQVEMDREYIHAASVRTYIALLLKTVPAVFSRQGAY